MKLIDHLKSLKFSEIEAAMQDGMQDWENPDMLGPTLNRRKRLVPAFHQLLGVLNQLSKSLPLDSKPMIAMVGAIKFFYTLIAVAEGQEALGDVIQSTDLLPPEEEKWAITLAEINFRRNLLEKKLRSVVLNFLRFSSLNSNTLPSAKDRILAIIDSIRRSQFANLSAEQVLDSTYMWSDLVKLIKKEWDLFARVFGDQVEFQRHCDIINDRPDAHAKHIDDADLAMYRRSLKWMEDMLAKI